ncbi:hypothetical protein J6590_075867 [Homalodisca vitripennis]|nr:hypothetical protein J6590_075867 [Homalodisca vitripennis]
MSDSIDSEMNTNEVLKRKRGIRNDDKYQRNVIKHKRLKGEEYTTKKGNLVPKATVGPDCNHQVNSIASSVLVHQVTG